MARDYEPLAPINAIRPPADRELREYPGSRDPLVVARLVWPGRIEVRPGRAVRRTATAVLVEWETRSGRKRTTWLPRADVARAVRFRRRSDRHAWPAELVDPKGGPGHARRRPDAA